ncbi:MAG: hypothetical protein QNL04_10730 [SAR324 cluster bacterium]|nr:hypothetical protein [SAR324 cluster bacterium]
MQNSLTKKLGLTVATIAMAATSMFTTTDAEAVPAFARQTGMTCNSCHFQAFPALNGMGRSFRSGGYTMKGTQTSIEGENIDLPSTLNMAVFWKAYYITGEDEVANLVWQDEAVMFAAGRVAASAGFLMELGLVVEADGTTAAEGESTSVEGTQFSNAKVQFNVAQAGSVNISVVPWSTDAAGRNFGMELMNTVGQRSQRPIEKRYAMSPGAVLGITQGAATGININAADLGTGYSASYIMWGPVHNGGNVNLTGMASSIRVAYFMDLAGFDTGIAIGQTIGDTVHSSSDDGATQDYDYVVGGSTFDFQMQGQIAGGDFGFYLQQATAADSADIAASTTSLTVASSGAGITAGGGSGLGYLLKYSITPAIQAHYASNTTTEDTTATAYTSVGVDYMVAENLRLQAFNYTEAPDDGSDATTHTYMGWNIGF